MAASTPIKEFVERAKSAGTPDASIVGMLTARGWPEKEVYEALALHYEAASGSAIPRRDGAGTAARDAFFYLVIFSTLATWTIALGALSFSLIEQWFSDSLFNNGLASYEANSIADSIACIIVAFPIYLLVSRLVLRQTRLHPEKLNSPVRKWLTYMALVVAAAVFIGDLIAVLTHFLLGQVNPQSPAEAAVVLILSGGVFSYYYGGLKKAEDTGESRRGWDRGMAAVSSIAIIVMICLGFWQSGGPGRQRLKRADERRLQDLSSLSMLIHQRWAAPSATKQLPQHLDELRGIVLSDPVTHQGYEYHPGEGSEYQLCAVFSLPSSQDQGRSRDTTWAHPAGAYCFHLDATRDSNFYY